MASERNNTEPQPYSGPPMVRVDGGKIRQLREARGLTQLYLSTVVGVTTDTISRWENKRYQSIKLENGEKLAQALEVPLSDIQEDLSPDEQGASQPDMQLESSSTSHPLNRQRAVIIACLILGISAALLTFNLLPEKNKVAVSATRILPDHVPAGQFFPVLIQVHSPGTEPISLIIKETVPPGGVAVHGFPSITTIDRKRNSLKWISKTPAGESVYAYMYKLPPTVNAGEPIVFKGTVTLKQRAGEQESIMGDSSLTVAPYHWADTNGDTMIDDEEILAVYDLYSDIKELQEQRDIIDNIWAGSGYRYDSLNNQYIILE